MLTTLLPIMAVVVVAYLVTGIAMPVLPIHVHQGLGFGTFVVGLVAGAQFAATLMSRLWAGRFSDTKGPKHAVIFGLCVAGAAGLLYLLSVRFAPSPQLSVTILLLGRALLGVMESFVITGALSWGLALAGSQNTGIVMSWVGTALYMAFAIVAPAGSALYATHGFGAVGVATMVLPLCTMLLVAPLRAVTPTADTRPSFSEVVHAIWRPGVALALSCVPRIAFGHLPDRVRGAKVALVSMLIEAVGPAVVWQASGFMVALLGVAISGLGYSLVYPGLGVEAVRSAPPQSRGVAMGTYTAFLDLSLGLASPALGFVAEAVSLSSVFLVSAVTVVATVGITWLLLFPRETACRLVIEDADHLTSES